jgi:uncharacterized protein DUF3667
VSSAPDLRLSDGGGPSWETTCLNCGAPLAGPFCSQCGQRAVPPHPTVRELLGDAFSELAGFDGKVAATIRLLLTRPGRLTNEMLEGRRARFIGPLRIYLTCSVIYFLIAAATPNRTKPQSQRSADFDIGGLPVQVSSSDSTPPPAKDSTAEQDLWRRLKHAAKSMNKDPVAIARAKDAYLPRALFALMPVYALLLLAFYWRRTYAEHLYFALHLHAFVFLALTIPQIAQALGGTVGNTINTVLSMVVIVWIPIYALKALRRVYGGSRTVTILKGTTIFTIYSIIAAIALILLQVLVAFVA